MFKTRFISMLVLLAAVATGAMAQEVTLLTTIESTGDNASFKSGSKTFDNKVTVTFSGEVENDDDEWGWYSYEEPTLTVTAAEGYTITRVKFYTASGSAFDEEAPFEAILVDDFGIITKVNGTSIGSYGVTKIEVYGYAGTPEPAASTYTVTLKEGTDDADKWTITPAEATTTGVAAGTEVKATYSGTKKVKSVKAKKKAAAGPTYNETKSINDGPVTVAAGEHWLITGTGTQTSNTMSIGAGATVTLDGVNISSDGYCIKCAGDATIILKDGSTNTLTGTGYQVYPALSAGDAGTTLTIQGSTGVLNVESVDYCAGIGGGLSNTNNTCGNIRIEGGVITVQGGYGGAGIGTDAGQATCGDIIITGGTITANGGGRAAGIGGGTSDYGNTVCGNITIANTVTKVTATAGNQAPYSIGKGYGSNASCGTITIGGTTGAITESPYTYAPSAAPAETTVTWDFSQLSGTAGTGYENGGVKLEACEGEISFDYNQLNAWGNGITITNTLGKKFTSIVINGTEYGVGIFGGGWSNADDNSSATWTGNSESVYIEGSSMASGITSIVFTLE